MLPAAHEKIPQLVEENRQFVRQAIEGDEVYFLPPALGTLPSRPADSSRLRTSLFEKREDVRGGGPPRRVTA